VSVTLAHPFRLDAAGAANVVAQGTNRHAVEVARHVVSCRVGERPLAPEWGLADPLADGVDEPDIYAAVDLCEPDVTLTSVLLRSNGDGGLDIIIDAIWSPGE
jgi:hypothetical protein